MFYIMYMGVSLKVLLHVDVNGGSLLRRVDSSDYIDHPIWEILERKTLLMPTIGDLIAVISLCLTCLGLGYSIGSNSDKTTKNDRP